MIKKILQNVALVTFGASLVFNSSNIYAELDDTYVKVSGGAIFLNNMESKLGFIDQTPDIESVKYKSSSVDSLIDFTAGYYLTDKIRLELSIEHLFNPKFSATSDDIKAADLNPVLVPISGIEVDRVTDISYNFKYKANVPMINVSVDLIHSQYVDFFVRAGLGFAFVDGENVTSAKYILTDGTDEVSIVGSSNTKMRNSTNVAYKISGGFLFKLPKAEGIYLELEGGYFNYGSTGKNKISTTSFKTGVSDSESDTVDTIANGIKSHFNQAIKTDKYTSSGKLSGWMAKAGVVFIF